MTLLTVAGLVVGTESFEQLRGLLGSLRHEQFAVLLHVVVGLLKLQTSDVGQRLLVVADVLQLNLRKTSFCFLFSNIKNLFLINFLGCTDIYLNTL